MDRPRGDEQSREWSPGLICAMTAAEVIRANSPLLLAAALTLTGCWTAPVANVQPPGEARLIQNGIAVRSVKEPAVVESVDPAASTIVLRAPGTSVTSTYKVAPDVSNFRDIKPGELVEATVAEELSVYVLRDGRLPGAAGASEEIAVDARVLSVDPSYRLLRLQYPNGQNETFKVPLEVKLRQMTAGDSVVISSVEVVALRRKG
jgi:hypothetical protein